MRVTDLIPWSRTGREASAGRNGDDRFGALQLDINRAFEDFWRRFDVMALGRSPDVAGIGAPPVDVRETNEGVEVKVELPGMEDGDVDVSIAEGALTIRGEKKAERQEEDRGFSLRERVFGRVERVIPLPDGLNLDAARANFRNGVLTITIPRAAQAQPSAKRISVKRS